MVSNQTRFSGLFQHPHEPLFLPKNNGTLFYDVPENYYTDRYRGLGPNLANRFGENARTRIPIRDIGMPDLSFANRIRRREGFSLFNKSHRAIAGRLIEMFINEPDVDSLTSLAAYSRDRLNAPLFQYALGVALFHRSDTRDVAVPSFLHQFPDRFVDPAIFPRLREEGMVVEQGNRVKWLVFNSEEI